MASFDYPYSNTSGGLTTPPFKLGHAWIITLCCVHVINWNVEHDIITRDAYSVSWAEIWEFWKPQRDIIDAVIISKLIVFEIISNVAY